MPLSHWLPSSRTTFLPCLFSFPQRFPPQNLFFQLCFYRSLFIFIYCHCSRAAVPGGTPSVQAATGSSRRVLLGELPVRPPQSRLGSRRGGAPTRRRSHRRGHREAALPNGGYVMKTGPVSHSKTSNKHEEHEDL